METVRIYCTRQILFFNPSRWERFTATEGEVVTAPAWIQKSESFRDSRNHGFLRVIETEEEAMSLMRSPQRTPEIEPESVPNPEPTVEPPAEPEAPEGLKNPVETQIEVVPKAQAKKRTRRKKGDAE